MALEDAKLSRAFASEQLLLVCGGGGGAGRVHGADASLSEAGTSGFGLYCGRGGAPPPSHGDSSLELTPRSGAEASVAAVAAVAASGSQSEDTRSRRETGASSVHARDEDEDDDKSFVEELEEIDDAV